MAQRNPDAIIRMKANDILLFYIADAISDGGINHFLPLLGGFERIVNPHRI